MNIIRIEKWAILISLLLYTLVNFLSLIPYTEKYIQKIPHSANNLVFAFFIFASFRYLIRIAEQTNTKETYKLNRHFSSALHEFKPDKRPICEMCIVAFTSTTWQEHIRATDFKIKSLKVLLLIAPNTSSAESTRYFEEMEKEKQKAIKGWKNILLDGRIDKLEIKQIEESSRLYFGIIDNNRVLLGLLWPNPNSFGVTPKEAITFESSRNNNSKRVVDHLQDWFDATWSKANKIN